MTLLLTFGLELVLINALVLVFSGDFRSIDTGWAGDSFAIGDVRVPYGRLAGFAWWPSAHAGAGALHVAHAPRPGHQGDRDGSDCGTADGDPGAGASTPSRSASRPPWPGRPGRSWAPWAPSARPPPARFTLQSFVIAVLGGLGNMWGALAGGLVLGLVQAWGGQYLSGTLVNAIAFGVLVAVLIVRPAGLLGQALLRGEDGDLMDKRPVFLSGRMSGRAAWIAAAVALLFFIAPARAAVRQSSSARSPAVFMFVALAQGWNLIGGFAGYPSFGNVVFFGLGGYTTAILMAKSGASLLAGAPRRRAGGAWLRRADGHPDPEVAGPLLRHRHARRGRGHARGRAQPRRADRRRLGHHGARGGRRGHHLLSRQRRLLLHVPRRWR